MKKLSSELVEDVKRKAPLTDTEKLAIESASEMYEEILNKYITFKTNLLINNYLIHSSIQI